MHFTYAMFSLQLLQAALEPCGSRISFWVVIFFFLQFSMKREQVSQTTSLKIPRQQMGRELKSQRHQPAWFTGVNIY